MPTDPVPGLLSRATELLEEQFAALPTFNSAADPAAMAPILGKVSQIGEVPVEIKHASLPFALGSGKSVDGCL